MPSTLIACPSCACHARSTESLCPACGAALRHHDGSVPRAAVAVLLGLTAATMSATGVSCVSDPVLAPAYGIATVGSGGSTTGGMGGASQASSSVTSTSTGSTGTTGGTGGASTGSTFSCDAQSMVGTTTTHVCNEYTNLPAADLPAETAACMADTGTVGTGCSTTNALGSCAYTSSGQSFAEFSYATNGVTAAEAQAACTASAGTWTPI